MRLLLDTHVLAWWVLDTDALSSKARSAISDHAIRAGLLPGPHRDPFDRLLAAQALTENLVLVTRDPIFADFGVETLW